VLPGGATALPTAAGALLRNCGTPLPGPGVASAGGKRGPALRHAWDCARCGGLPALGARGDAARSLLAVLPGICARCGATRGTAGGRVGVGVPLGPPPPPGCPPRGGAARLSQGERGEWWADSPSPSLGEGVGGSGRNALGCPRSCLRRGLPYPARR